QEPASPATCRTARTFPVRMRARARHRPGVASGTPSAPAPGPGRHPAGPSMHLVAHAVLVGLLALGASIVPAGAQDVEMLGQRYGTRPPDAYYREIARDRDAYRFARGRAGRIRVAPAGGRDSGGAQGVGPRLGLGPRDQPVEGEFVIPVLLGRFADSPGTETITADDVADGYFGAGETVSAYYDEVSGGRVSLDGAVMDWRAVELTQAQVTRGDGGL